MWALASVDFKDDETWRMLARLAISKNFNYEIVANRKWSATQFKGLRGNEHFRETLLDGFVHNLFFRDGINTYELYYGLLEAKKNNPHLTELTDAINHLEKAFNDVPKKRAHWESIDSSIDREAMKNFINDKHL